MMEDFTLSRDERALKETSCTDHGRERYSLLQSVAIHLPICTLIDIDCVLYNFTALSRRLTLTDAYVFLSCIS